MQKRGLKITLVACLLMAVFLLKGQDAFMDPATRSTLDSLDRRITLLEREMPRLAQKRSPQYFFKKQELDFTIFLSLYERFLFDEDLDQASELVDSRLKGAQKRRDETGIAYYQHYRTEISKAQKVQQQRYQKLFEKEKNFRKEFNRFLQANDAYSLQRALRMVQLAQKYAAEKNLNEVARYLMEYEKLAQASWYDFNSDYDLNKLTHSDSYFQKHFTPLVESDSIELIHEAKELVKNCMVYARNSKSVLDSAYFAMQGNVVNTSISDYYARIGNNSSLETLGGQSIIARFDTLNREGVYKWQDAILVVGHFKPAAKFDNVKKGEAIIDADHKLAEYIRVNRLAKLGKSVKMGTTYVVPFYRDEEMEQFCFNPDVMKYQYMVCYTQIESQYMTKEISKFLPPLQFDVELDETEM